MQDLDNNKVRILPISIIIFMILAIIAALVILKKGRIGNYSLVNMQSTISEENVKKYDPNSTIEIKADKKYLSVKSKEDEDIQVLINGEIVDNSEVEFETSDDEILEVNDEGTITAVSVGKATITAKVEDLVATYDFRTVIPITSMSFTTTNSVVRVGGTLQMKLIAKPSDANIETLKYTSSDESIATVNANGIVTGVKAGKVKITVTDLYTEISKSVNLTIK